MQAGRQAIAALKFRDHLLETGDCLLHPAQLGVDLS